MIEPDDGAPIKEPVKRTPAILTVFTVMLCGPQLWAKGNDLKHPDWHPDGNVLVAEGSCSGNTDLYLIDIASGKVELLYGSDYIDGYPRWFADGKRIAFHQIDLHRRSRIHIATVESGDITSVQQVTQGPFDIEPAPSPDGASIAYSSKGDPRQNIALLNMTTGDTKVWDSEFSENLPSWFPNGDSIIYHARKTDETQIHRRILLTYQISDLTRKGSPNRQGHFDADGKRLAFSSERTGDREIYILTLQSGIEIRITNRDGRDGYPKISPDGDRIAYHSVIEEHGTVVRIKNLENGELLEYGCADITPR